jgi:hypothetical protein
VPSPGCADQDVSASPALVDLSAPPPLPLLDIEAPLVDATDGGVAQPPLPHPLRG